MGLHGRRKLMMPPKKKIAITHIDINNVQEDAIKVIISFLDTRTIEALSYTSKEMNKICSKTDTWKMWTCSRFKLDSIPNTVDRKSFLAQLLETHCYHCNKKDKKLLSFDYGKGERLDSRTVKLVMCLDCCADVRVMKTNKEICKTSGLKEEDFQQLRCVREIVWTEKSAYSKFYYLLSDVSRLERGETWGHKCRNRYKPSCRRSHVYGNKEKFTKRISI